MGLLRAQRGEQSAEEGTVRLFKDRGLLRLRMRRRGQEEEGEGHHYRGTGEGEGEEVVRTIHGAYGGFDWHSEAQTDWTASLWPWDIYHGIRMGRLRVGNITRHM